MKNTFARVFCDEESHLVIILQYQKSRLNESVKWAKTAAPSLTSDCGLLSHWLQVRSVPRSLLSPVFVAGFFVNRRSATNGSHSGAWFGDSKPFRKSTAYALR
jgi:hypothetical protein